MHSEYCHYLVCDLFCSMRYPEVKSDVNILITALFPHMIAKVLVLVRNR
jgi:hypothetical protein